MPGVVESRDVAGNHEEARSCVAGMRDDRRLVGAGANLTARPRLSRYQSRAGDDGRGQVAQHAPRRAGCWG